MGRYRKANVTIKAPGVSTLGNLESGFNLTNGGDGGSQCIPRKRGLIFGGNATKDKPHGLTLCWVACCHVLWCPRMVPQSMLQFRQIGHRVCPAQLWQQHGMY